MIIWFPTQKPYLQIEFSFLCDYGKIHEYTDEFFNFAQIMAFHMVLEACDAVLEACDAPCSGKITEWKQMKVFGTKTLVW